MKGDCHSLLVILWWFPSHFQNNVLTSYTANTVFHDQFCITLQLIFHSQWPGTLFSSRTELDSLQTHVILPQELSAACCHWLCWSAHPSCWMMPCLAPGNVHRQTGFLFLSASVMPFAISVSVSLPSSAGQNICLRASRGHGAGLSNRHEKYKS